MATIEVQLSVARVISGGNAKAGLYFFSFTPNHIEVNEKNTTINVTLSADTPADMAIVSVLSGDALKQLETPILAPGGRSFSVVNRNTEPYMFSLGARIYDKLRDTYLICDPQIINVPEF